MNEPDYSDLPEEIFGKHKATKYICIYKSKGIERPGNKLFHTYKAAYASARNAESRLVKICKVEY